MNAPGMPPPGVPRSPDPRTPRLAWHAGTPATVLDHCQGNGLSGLTRDEAAHRMARVGANRLLGEKKPSFLSRVVAQIRDFTVLALLGAAGIAFVLGFVGPAAGGFLVRFGDSLAILTIVILNAVLGLYQERRAERALDALKEMTAPTAHVIRDGEPAMIPAADLVPGDLVILSAGAKVPADIRLLKAHDLWLSEAALTGESLPVLKNALAELPSETPLAERVTMVFQGTQVDRGRGHGVVTNTGMHTELGSIAGMLAEVTREPTPLEQDLTRFGRRLVLGCIGVSALVFIAGLVVGRQSTRELFMVAVALAVAAIPEGLPAVTTIVLALGTQRMALRHALVRRLPAVETLGCTQVICTDKTGTLTQNRMQVRALLIVDGTQPSGATLYQVKDDGAILTADAQKAPAGTGPLSALLLSAAHATAGDPTDAALLLLAQRAGKKARGRVVSEHPFSSHRRMASVTLDDQGKKTIHVRGAPEVILGRCTHAITHGDGDGDGDGGGGPVALSPALSQALLAQGEGWAHKAMRVIALARKPIEAEGGDDPETGLHFLGLLGLHDPPRAEVAAAVAEARAAGIKTLMITGDHPATGRAIAREIGLWEEGDELLTGAELDRMDRQQLVGRIDAVRVVARATAEHKLRIVEALKARGYICAMTGDGVNDAPAVKAASIGIAMGCTGTDVTKEAASLVLSDDNFATIIAAVEEGRAIYANIRKSVFFLLSSNAGCVLAVFAASLFGWRTPVLPVQILWINLITNGLPALALGLDGREPEQMREPPRKPGGSMLSPREYLHIVLIGAVMAATAMAAYNVALFGPERAATPALLLRARSICYGILSLGPLCHAFNCRSTERSIFAGGLAGLFSNRALWGAVTCGLVLWAVTIYVPFLRAVFNTAALDGGALLWVAAMSLLPVVAIEIAKRLRMR